MVEEAIVDRERMNAISSALRSSVSEVLRSDWRVRGSERPNDVAIAPKEETEKKHE